MNEPTLRQFPIKIRDVSVNSPYFHRAELLLVGDCAAYAHPGFHAAFTGGRVLLIGCPKHDFRLGEQLEDILRNNEVLSVSLVKTDADCCREMWSIVANAVRQSSKDIPVNYTNIILDAEIIE
ncbi:MAG: hypothetical protein LBC65_04395 [Oscillospiraceae bacterium]|jgi:hypothetical protein|nr:hypothetical protein [Oscillospiraceae bacterium]